MTSLRPAALLAVFLFLLSAPTAVAQTDADRATARSLARKAQEALDARDFATAEDLFTRAEALVSAPTLLLRLARAQAGLHKLVESHESYRRADRFPMPANPPAEFIKAAEDARAEMAALAPRIPALVIKIEGPPDAQVTVDGVALPRAAIGVPRFVNPGPHVVGASAHGFLPGEARVDAAEGKTVDVPLRLAVDPTATAPRATPAPAITTPGAEVNAAPSAAERKTSAGKVATVVVLGAGTAALAFAATTGVLAVKVAGDRSSPATGPEDEEFHRLRTVSLTSLGVGAALAGGALLFAPDETVSARTAWGHGLVGFGIGSLLGGLGSALIGQSIRSDLESICPGDVCPVAQRPNADAERRFGVLSLAALAAGAASAGIGSYLLMSDDAQAPRASRRRWALLPGPGTLTLAGVLP